MAIYLAKYPQRPLLGEHESLLGFVHRLKDLNDFSWADVAGDLGSQPLRGALSVDQLCELSRLSGRPFDRLAYAQHELATGEPKLYGRAIPVRALAIGQSRVCVRCMADVESHLRIWDLKALELCPVHSVALIDRCPLPGCAKRLSWERPVLVQCPKGHSMAEMSEYSQRQFGSHFAERVIYETVGLAHGRELVRLQLPSVIRDLPLPSFIEFAKFLGVLVNDRDKSISLDRQADSPRSSSSKLMNAGARIARRWPDAFHGLIQGGIVNRRYTTRDRIVRFSQRHIQRTAMEHTNLLREELRKVDIARASDSAPTQGKSGHTGETMEDGSAPVVAQRS